MSWCQILHAQFLLQHWHRAGAQYDYALSKEMVSGNFGFQSVTIPQLYALAETKALRITPLA